MLFSIAGLVALASTVTATYVGNLNFDSPSTRHSMMGLDMQKIMNRHAKRDGENRYVDPKTLNFTHGVASGDPYPDSIILWTRVAPQVDNDRSNVTVSGYVELYSHETDAYIEASTKPICVDWKVNKNKDLSGPADSEGRAYTVSDIDYTVKIEAGDLEAFTTYYYQFTVCGSSVRSPIGRFKTSPEDYDDPEKLSFAIFRFNAYGSAARADNAGLEWDYFVHLGDYIYETNAGVGARATQPNRTIFTLYDYRRRIAQLIHRNHAAITVWDDHEIANNGYRDGFSDMTNNETSFLASGSVSVDQRKMNAVRAYFEWMPIRQVDLDDNLRIWRTFKLGRLADLVLLDSRNYDRSITTLRGNDRYIAGLANDAGRTLMGSRQEHWFRNELSRSKRRGATWRIIGQQIVFSRINSSSAIPLNGDAWDGYQATRNRTLNHLFQKNISNTIFLAGDSHQNYVSDLAWVGANESLHGNNDVPRYDPVTGDGALGVEWSTTAVSSTGQSGTFDVANQAAERLVKNNVELKWQEGRLRGYTILRLTKSQATAEYWAVPNVRERNNWTIPIANFTTIAGSNRLKRPLGGGAVLTGYLENGVRKDLNSSLALNTGTGAWEVVPNERLAGSNFLPTR